MPSAITSTPCSACGRTGGLHYRRTLRIRPRTFVAYVLIFLASLVGAGVGVLGLSATRSTLTALPAKLDREHRDDLAKIEGLTAEMIEAIAAPEDAERDALGELRLTPDQLRAVERSRARKTQDRTVSLIVEYMSGVAFVVIVMSCLVCGVLGGLLIFVERIVTCSLCQGTHSPN